ncbi:MAG: hypothetical protein OXG52_06050 [bacterium]|nr:hypothetical protein [bacterium]
MAPLGMIATFAGFGLASFGMGMLVPVMRHNWYRRRFERGQADGGVDGAVTKADIRGELCRDPTALSMFMDDDTPEDVQRYLFLEAERRAIMRKRKQLADNENDFFAPPRRPGPDPGFRGCQG